MIPWFAWVPSDSNIADAPSRNDFIVMTELSFVRRDVTTPVSFGHLEKYLASSCSEGGDET